MELSRNAHAALPTFDQLASLRQYVEPLTIPTHFEDENGHVNVRHYFDLGSRAIAIVYDEMGISDDYRQDRGLGFFTAEQHLRYYAEMHVGHETSATMTVVERSDKIVHSIAYVLNRTTACLAATLESVAPHVDLTTRRVTPMPDDVARNVDRQIASQSTSWVAPVCGAMGVRRRR
ncbi:thioesterase family protein [Janibacter sp. YIM B02568]|uniref:thioesterase family protein n=1 Tax=Janibacter endophyticus TaxID=2806261 RepID=UPI0019503D34|nr:thioesterase family protein [Janibacter endophyticus]MBM6545447.1 thioesterase family protein [Janibacter endophyticus]